jgi:hypothetical protein
MEMNLWSNDGSVASNFIFGQRRLLDVCYDTSDGVYYGIRWNYDSEYKSGGFSFIPETESGTESADVLFRDDFVEATTSWRRSSIPPITVETRISAGPPATVTTAERKWTAYSGSYYTGRSVSPNGWDSALWAQASNFTTVLETRSTDMFQVDVNEGRLVYYSDRGMGYVDFDVEVDGDFVAFMDLNVTSFGSSDAVLCLRCLSQNPDRPEDPYNCFLSYDYRGPSTGTNDRLQVWTILKDSDTSTGMWSISNLRINERYLDTASSWTVANISMAATNDADIYINIDDFYTNAITNPEYSALFSVDFRNTVYVVTSLGDGIFSTAPSATTRVSPYYGETYRSFSWTGGTLANPDWAGKFASFDIRAGYTWDPVSSSLKTYLDDSVVNTYMVYNLHMDKYDFSSYAARTNLRMAIKREETLISVMVRDNSKDIDEVGGAYTTIYNFESDYSGPVRFELYADGVIGGLSPSIYIERFVVRDLFVSERTGSYTKPTTRWLFPVLTIETYDSDGKVVYTGGITDGSGRAIKSLDAIKSSVYEGGKFSEYYGKVRIATDHGDSGDELYLSINNDLYKYLKMNLPITTDSGSLADQYNPGGMFGTALGNTLAYNEYTAAGLIYIAENEADPGDGLYVNCLRNEVMAANDPAKFVWIDKADSSFYLYASDPNDFSLLYGLSTTDRVVYLYNLSEYASAFCNVISEKQIMAANTSETAEVAAQVINVYGDVLASKSVSFSVSSGDGAVSPATDTTDGSGEAQTTYTVGSTVGASTITATVTD